MDRRELLKSAAALAGLPLTMYGVTDGGEGGDLVCIFVEHPGLFKEQQRQIIQDNLYALQKAIGVPVVFLPMGLTAKPIYSKGDTCPRNSTRS